MANWLYNGVELPALPDYDAAAYPYIFIDTINGISSLIFSSYPFELHYTSANSTEGTYYLSELGNVLCYYIRNGGTSWLYDVAGNNTDSVGHQYPTHTFVWSNYDVKTLTAGANTGIAHTGGPAPVNAETGEKIDGIYDEPEPEEAETPTFTTNLTAFAEYTYTQGDTADTLSVEAEVSDGGTITYQWYMDDAEIPGATGSSYTPEADKIGTRTYFCRATNTLESGLTATADSNAVTVKTLLAFNPACYILGRQFGKRIIAQREPKKPVAYLYNGVQLPALPEWDRGAYPYAVIGSKTYTDGLIAYYFFADDNPFSVYPDSGMFAYRAYPGVAYRIDPEVPWAWEEWLMGDTGIAYIWSNYDVPSYYDSSVTVYPASSHPVPVYE